MAATRHGEDSHRPEQFKSSSSPYQSEASGQGNTGHTLSEDWPSQDGERVHLTRHPSVCSTDPPPPPPPGAGTGSLPCLEAVTAAGTFQPEPLPTHPTLGPVPSPPRHPMTALVIRMSFLCRSWTAQRPRQRPPEHTLGQGPCVTVQAEHFDQLQGSLGTVLGSSLTGVLTVTMRVKAPNPPSLLPPFKGRRLLPERVVGV